MDPLTEQVKMELLVAQSFTDTDDLTDRRMTIVDMMLLGVLDKPHDERRHAHDSGRVQALDGIPLQFRDSVTYANDAGAHMPYAHPIGETCHEPLVEGRHQLQDISFLESRTSKRLMLVICQTLQVRFGATEKNGVS